MKEGSGLRKNNVTYYFYILNALLVLLKGTIEKRAIETPLCVYEQTAYDCKAKGFFVAVALWPF